MSSDREHSRGDLYHVFYSKDAPQRKELMMANVSQYVEEVTELWNATDRNVTQLISTTTPKTHNPDIQQSSSVETISIVCILCLFSIVGTLGNGLVLYVFTRTTQKLTSTIFIIALAGTDFVTCLIIIPYTVIAIHTSYELAYDAACKAYQFLITCPVPLSAFIMVAIAVDRYICICHPFAQIMTVRRAKIIVSILTAFAVILGIITALGNSIYEVRRIPVNTTGLEPVIEIPVNHTGDISFSTQNDIVKGSYNIENTPKYIDVVKLNGTCQLSETIFSYNFIQVYQKVYSLLFLCSLLIVLILYILIYSSVTRQRAKRKAQKREGRVKQVNTQCQTDESTMPLTNMANKKNATKSDAQNNLKVEMDGETVNTRLSTMNSQANGNIETSETKPIKPTSVRKATGSSSDQKDKKDHNRLANIKTAVMLFTVTVVFITAFLPAWLMAHGWLEFNMVVFYMYFAYNVANPVIYAFMNQMFRDNLCKLVSSCRMYYNSRRT
ncbi:uncharacterized protein LOC128246195 [Mya arenaria]|uniref:uncharacterized protein LOC128246195 n=1 Tax=Mya arenaria TaxID=6604 RepID=UPI0022E7D53A|nr:uncharacterized protein LOC128246195 [Mya arenaria]